ncbi:hypothetical protein GEM17_22630 [Salmonella enterica]|nr:hypothetical protein [Salmonella enterica]
MYFIIHIISYINYLFMVNIILSMILSILSNYHIFCGVSVTQIRKLQKPEPNLSKYLISQLLYILTFIIFFVLKSYNAC